ncbi:uncharacterized protein LOC129616613 [Condylostylus longicornis]|uniref:uncharacterized protein LOC129616613 n=1 Tax=Condylostylus longicornis TaxID=2530218 RepID=UPI00244E1DBE|nr:uncharacterized protein LOC129616613 [Condylostylus longicornis]
MPSCEIGLIGLAVMGQNLALNIAQHGFKISVYNRTASKVDDTLTRAKNEGNLPVEGHKDLPSFIDSIAKPRKIILLVKAGPAVDKILDDVVPLLAKGDMVIDGGNEWFESTEARTTKMEALGFKYLGMGVSGGEDGARYGPALMPGGSPDAYEALKPIVEKIAAQVEEGPCVSYIGPGGSGNYVKMVHNGIEYGDMELIAEAYDLLKRLGGLTNDDLNEVFKRWNQGELQSFLIEITADIFTQVDEYDNHHRLIDKILDVAGSKGTGMWTVQEAARRGVPIPTIQSALDMRYISVFKKLRVDASRVFPKRPLATQDKERLIKDVQDALYCSKICSYAQGMILLRVASDEQKWNLNLAEIARGWKGGCIIRAKFLDRIRSAFTKNKELQSLLLDESFAEEIKEREAGWRRVVSMAQQQGIPVAALSASLSYFDAASSDHLPLNLVQAQRDYFGAHTYKRIDRTDGPHHTIWARTTEL